MGMREVQEYFKATQETVFRRSTSIGSNLGHVVKDAARPSAARVQGLGLVEALVFRA